MKALMNTHFGFDFAHVHVHYGPTAAASAAALGAAAYTVGSSIFFGQGKYEPHTQEGRRLIAHELSHVVQAGWGPPNPLGDLRVASPSSVPELEARRVAETLDLSEGKRTRSSPGLSPAPLLVYCGPDENPHAPHSVKPIVYIDASVIIWIEKGNVRAATLLKNLLATSEVRIPNSVYNELTSKPAWKETATAHRILIEDLRLNVWDAPEARVNALTSLNTIKKKTGVIYSADRGDVPALAAVTPDATYLTLDGRLYNNRQDITRRLGVEFNPNSFVPEFTTVPPDYSTARSLLGLDPIIVEADGKLERRGRQGSTRRLGSSGQTSQHPSGKIVSGEILNNDHLPEEPDKTGGGPSYSSPTNGNAAQMVAPGELEAPTLVTAGDLASEIGRVEKSTRRMQSLAEIMRTGLEIWNFVGHLELIASSLNLATTTLNGGPLQKEKEAAIAIATNAKALADYYEGLDLRKEMPSRGWMAWDGGWSELQMIQFDYYQIESHMGEALESVDAAIKNIALQIHGLSEAVKEKEEALVLALSSLPYADAYLFADAAGQVRGHLIDAANEYARARSGIYFSRQMVRAAIKFMEIRLRQLGVSGLYNVESGDLRLNASLDHFTIRQ